MNVECLRCGEPLPVRLAPFADAHGPFEVVGDAYRHVDPYDAQEWDEFQSRCAAAPKGAM